MRKIKKLAALILAGALVLGMSTTAFAENADAKPTADNKATATIKGVEAGATITAYQIVDADYNDFGLKGYVRVNGVTETELPDIYNPTYDQVMEIAKKELTAYTAATWAYADGVYTAELEAGSFLIKVSGTGTVVYNPLLVSIGYDKDKSGSMNQLLPGEVSAADSWKLSDATVVAKSSPITLTKDVNDHEAEVDNDTVTFTVETTIPAYSAEYTTVTFKITDKIINGLAYTEDAPVVKVGGEELAADKYTYTPGTDSFTIDFKSDYVKGLANAPADKREVVVTYDATVTDDAITEVGENEVTLNYTTKPGVHTGEIKDTEYVNTFEFDGVLQKVKEDKKTALEGATFTLYRDEALTDVFGTYTTLADGNIKFEGLDADVAYYLKETAAPAGYSLNDTVYKIEFKDLVFDQNTGKVTSYKVYVDGVEKDVVVYGTPDAEFEDAVVNTKLAALPSTGGIGTTIFTIGGVVIIVAAASMLFARRRVAR